MANAVVVAYNEIRRRIVDGSYGEGARLPETRLVAEIGVSRTPIREALRRLHSEGLVTFTPNKGARVATWSEQDLEDILGMRLALESYAARIAATRIGPDQIAELERLATQMETTLRERGPDYYPEIAELNNEFHRKVVQAAGSSSLLSVLSTVVEVPAMSQGAKEYVEMPLVRRAVHPYDVTELERSAAHHREIIAALADGDAEWAESIIRTHILASRAAHRRTSRSSRNGST